MFIVRPLIIALLVLLLAWPFSSTIVGSPSVLMQIQLLRALGLAFGSLGLSLYAVTLLLITRSRLAEIVLDGLPAVYRYHHVLGTLAFLCLLAHPLFLALAYLSEDPTVAVQFLLVPRWPVTALGWAALGVIILFMVATFLVQLPYEIWRWTHIFSGLGFTLGTIHAMFALNRPGSLVMVSGVFILGFGSFIYWEVWRRLFKRRFSYQVIHNVEKTPSVVELELAPRLPSHKLTFHPGQFIYVSLNSDTDEAHRCGLGRESHPFTISSSTTDKSIRLLIKALGDYTSKVSKIAPGTNVQLEGPYGRFFSSLMRSPRKTQMWIAGGIGITPFLSCARSNKGGQLKAHLHYFMVNKHDDFASDEIMDIARQTKGFRAYVYFSDDEGLPSIEQIEKNTPTLKHYQAFLISGPEGMRRKITKELQGKGIKRHSIITENFNFI